MPVGQIRSSTKQHITFFWEFTDALDWKSVWNTVKAREASDGFKSIFFVNIHCHCVSSVCRWAAKAGVLILCIVAAISIPMVFLMLSAIDKNVFSTSSEVLLPRFEGIKPQQLFDRTWLYCFIVLKMNVGEILVRTWIWGEIQALKSVINWVRIEAFSFNFSLAKKP